MIERDRLVGARRSVGRPTLALGDLRSVIVRTRLSPQEHAALMIAARVGGVSVSEFVHRAVAKATKIDGSVALTATTAGNQVARHGA